jgi:ribosomal protein S18 acetylase RimI-like enzyme
MPDPQPIPLTPVLIKAGSPEFDEILNWPYADPFVNRLLQTDIPQRAQNNFCRVWIYRDPQGGAVGFGSLDLCKDYAQFTDDRFHTYIPLLAVNPTIKSLGYGTTIVRHLSDEATLSVMGSNGMSDILFLDVYTTSEKAIALYVRCGFQTLTTVPIADTASANDLYWIMAKRVSLAKTSS